MVCMIESQIMHGKKKKSKYVVVIHMEQTLILFSARPDPALAHLQGTSPTSLGRMRPSLVLMWQIIDVLCARCVPAVGLQCACCVQSGSHIQQYVLSLNRREPTGIPEYRNTGSSAAPLLLLLLTLESSKANSKFRLFTLTRSSQPSNLSSRHH